MQIGLFDKRGAGISGGGALLPGGDNDDAYKYD